MNQTLRQIQKIFKLRKCRNTQFKNRSRPCLNFQIKACLGLCCNAVSSEEYHKQVKDAVLFLKGQSRQVVKKLETRMHEYAEELAYEKAAQVRDSLAAVKTIMERQVVVSPDMMDRDILAVAADKGRAVVTVMVVRSGALIDTTHYPVDLGFKEPDEILSAFCEQYYRHGAFLPASILLSHSVGNADALASILTERKGRKVSLHVPLRGEKKRLKEMALANAEKELEKRLLKEAEQQAAVSMLRDLLGMDTLPERIECYDNSSLSGQDPVSSMVVFKHGRPHKKAYRRFMIRDIDHSDDYACMYQVLQRRFAQSQSQMPHPDLVVVDGGKGQLGMAVAVLNDLGIDRRFTVVGLAKKNEAANESEDKIYVPGRSNPLNANQAVKALYLLQQVRDEAHRFAVTFQRSRREKRAVLSVLDDIPGIGPQRKKTLLKHFKGISRMKSASPDEMSQLEGMTTELAKRVLAVLNNFDQNV